MLSRDSVTVSVDAVCFYKVPFFQSIGFHLFSVYSVPSFFSLWGSVFFQSMGLYLVSVYGVPSLLILLLKRTISIQGSIFSIHVKPSYVCWLSTCWDNFLNQGFSISALWNQLISTHLLETIMSPFLHQIFPVSNHKCSQKEIWEVGKVKIGGVGSGHCWSTMGPIYKKIHVINFIHFLLSARRDRA